MLFKMSSSQTTNIVHASHMHVYWVTQQLPQIYTANHATFPKKIRKITVHICGNFWITQYNLNLLSQTTHFVITKILVNILQIKSFTIKNKKNTALSLSLSVSPFLSLSLSVSFSLYLFFSLSLFLSISFSLFLSISFSLYLFLSFFLKQALFPALLHTHNISLSLSVLPLSRLL